MLQLRKASHRSKDSVLDDGSLSEIRAAPSVPGFATDFGKTVVISCTLDERKGQIPLPGTYERIDVTNVIIFSCGWDLKVKGGPNCPNGATQRLLPRSGSHIK